MTDAPSTPRRELLLLALLLLALLAETAWWRLSRSAPEAIWTAYLQAPAEQQVATLRLMVTREGAPLLDPFQVEALLRSEDRPVREWLMTPEVTRLTGKEMQWAHIACQGTSYDERVRSQFLLQVPDRTKLPQERAMGFLRSLDGQEYRPDQKQDDTADEDEE